MLGDAGDSSIADPTEDVILAAPSGSATELLSTSSDFGTAADDTSDDGQDLLDGFADDAFDEAVADVAALDEVFEQLAHQQRSDLDSIV